MDLTILSNFGDFAIFFELPSIIFNGTLKTQHKNHYERNYYHFVGKTELFFVEMGNDELREGKNTIKEILSPSM